MRKLLILALSVSVFAALLSAQAPESLNGKSAVVVISSGTGPFAPVGGYRISFAATGNSYTITPLSSTVDPSQGVYLYERLNSTSARLSVIDSLVGATITQLLNFLSASTATFSASAGGGSTSGTLVIEGVTSTTTIIVPVPTGERLINLSTLTTVSRQITVGFVLSQESRVLVRAVGPALSGFGVSGVSTDPSLELYNAGGGVAASNNDWSETEFNRLSVEEAQRSAGAFVLPVGSKDAALVRTLPAGAHTAIAYGSGNVLIEVYRLP